MERKSIFALVLKNKDHRQFVKFAIVGSFNTLVDWLFFYLFKFLLLGKLGLPDIQMIRQVAKALSFIVSASSGYILNRKWTFRSSNKNIAKEATKFLLVSLGGMLINQTVFFAMTAKFGWRDIFGLAAATAVATFWNFFINKKWTFKT